MLRVHYSTYFYEPKVTRCPLVKMGLAANALCCLRLEQEPCQPGGPELSLEQQLHDKEDWPWAKEHEEIHFRKLP